MSHNFYLNMRELRSHARTSVQASTERRPSGARRTKARFLPELNA